MNKHNHTAVDLCGPGCPANTLGMTDDALRIAKAAHQPEQHCSGCDVGFCAVHGTRRGYGLTRRDMLLLSEEELTDWEAHGVAWVTEDMFGRLIASHRDLHASLAAAERLLKAKARIAHITGHIYAGEDVPDRFWETCDQGSCCELN